MSIRLCSDLTAEKRRRVSIWGGLPKVYKGSKIFVLTDCADLIIFIKTIGIGRWCACRSFIIYIHWYWHISICTFGTVNLQIVDIYFMNIIN